MRPRALLTLAALAAGSLRASAAELEQTRLANGLDLLLKESHGGPMVASIVTVSRDLGITVVAEGIETAAERAAVAGLGCDLMQGFFFRHPEPWREGDGISLAAEGSRCPPTSGS